MCRWLCGHVDHLHLGQAFYHVVGATAHTDSCVCRLELDNLLMLWDL